MVFTTDNGVLPAANFNYSPVYTTSDFSTQFVAKYLHNINASVAAGPDSPPDNFWKSMLLALSIPLSIIYYASFSSS